MGYENGFCVDDLKQRESKMQKLSVRPEMTDEELMEECLTNALLEASTAELKRMEASAMGMIPTSAAADLKALKKKLGEILAALSKYDDPDDSPAEMRKQSAALWNVYHKMTRLAYGR